MKINNIFYAALAALTLVSCNQDYREVSVYDEDYVKTTFARTGGLISQIYTYLESDFGNYSGALLASATDESVYTRTGNSVQGFYNGSWNATNNLDGGRWAKCWTGISYANLFLDEFNNEQFKEYEADINFKAEMFQYKNFQYEARALRAYYYFELVRMFGGVPLKTTNMNATEANALARSSADDVFKFIDDECAAIKDLIVEDYNKIVDENGISMNLGGKIESGRVNNLFVLALRARAAMYHASPLFTQGKSEDEKKALWKAAVEANQEVITKCKLRQMKLVDDYASLFGTDNWTNSTECIFVRRNISASNSFEKYNFPLGMENAEGANCPTQNLVNAYFSVAGLVDAQGNPVIQDSQNPYSQLDKRFANTVAVNGEMWPASNDNALQTYVGGMHEANGVSYGSTTGYYLKKYVNNSTIIGGSKANSFRHHWVIFRLAEFYLNYAEAIMNYTGSGYDKSNYNMTAADAINVVRTRAGLANIADGLSFDAFKSAYENERFVELAFEGHRFYDVRRWMEAPKYFTTIQKMEIKKTADAVYDADNATVITPAQYSYEPKVLETRQWNDRFYLFPIAQGEIMKAPNLTQNQGW